MRFAVALADVVTAVVGRRSSLCSLLFVVLVGDVEIMVCMMSMGCAMMGDGFVWCWDLRLRVEGRRGS